MKWTLVKVFGNTIHRVKRKDRRRQMDRKIDRAIKG